MLRHRARRGAASAKNGKEAMIALLDQAANLGSAVAEYELGVVDEDSQNTKKDKNQTMDCAGKWPTRDRGGQSSSSDRRRLQNPQRPASG
jgi:hypothetical protein